MKAKTLRLLVVAIICSMATACSDKAPDTLTSVASAGDVAVLALRPQTVIENAGCQVTNDGITVSEAVSKLAHRGLIEGLEVVTKARGLDMGLCIVAITPDLDWIAAMKVANRQAFEMYLTDDLDLEAETDGEYKSYGVRRGTAVLVSDAIAYVLSTHNGNATAERLDAMLERAEEAPLQAWKERVLAKDGVANAVLSIAALDQMMEHEGQKSLAQSTTIGLSYDPQEIANGYILVNSTLQGTRLQSRAVVADAEGSTLKSRLQCSPVDLSLAKYACAKDMAIGFASVPKGVDWGKVIDEAAANAGGYSALGLSRDQAAVLAHVLGDVDGTVMFAAGPANLLKYNTLQGWSLVLAAQMAPGKAAQDIAIAAEGCRMMGWSVSVNGNTAVLAYRDQKCYLQDCDGTLVASTEPVSPAGGCNIDLAPFAGKTAGLVIDIPKQNPLSAFIKFPFGLKLAYVADDEAIDTSLCETDTDGMLLDNLAKFVASLI